MKEKNRLQDPLVAVGQVGRGRMLAHQEVAKRGLDRLRWCPRLAVVQKVLARELVWRKVIMRMDGDPRGAVLCLDLHMVRRRLLRYNDKRVVSALMGGIATTRTGVWDTTVS